MALKRWHRQGKKHSEEMLAAWCMLLNSKNIWEQPRVCPITMFMYIHLFAWALCNSCLYKVLTVNIRQWKPQRESFSQSALVSAKEYIKLWIPGSFPQLWDNFSFLTVYERWRVATNCTKPKAGSLTHDHAMHTTTAQERSGDAMIQGERTNLVGPALLPFAARSWGAWRWSRGHP